MRLVVVVGFDTAGVVDQNTSAEVGNISDLCGRILENLVELAIYGIRAVHSAIGCHDKGNVVGHVAPPGGRIRPR